MTTITLNEFLINRSGNNEKPLFIYKGRTYRYLDYRTLSYPINEIEERRIEVLTVLDIEDNKVEAIKVGTPNRRMYNEEYVTIL
jgi:hypothetical protein